MGVRPYAVFTLPAKDTVLGRLSEGCRVELTVSPQQHESLGSCYAVRFQVQDILPGEAWAAEVQLRDVYASLVESRVDAGTNTWTASAWIPVQNVGTRTFRLLEQAPAGMAPAWVVMKAGLAQVRLRPLRGPIDGFLAALFVCLREHGIDADLMVLDLDDTTHDRGAKGLHRMPEPILA